MPHRRVVVHAGFHKTGTTTVQAFLRANRKHIFPRCALVLPRRLRGGAARYAVRYSRFGTEGLLNEFGYALRSVLRALDVKNRNVLICDENLAGLIPGREGQLGYHATPTLMVRMEGVIREVFGHDTDVQFHFTTRAPQDWLGSVYKHVLRTSRLGMELDEFLATYRAASDLNGVATEVADAVKGTVTTRDLGSFAGHEGPAEPLIDLIQLPAHLRRRLNAVPRENIGVADGRIKDLLALNRSTLSDRALKAAKTELLKQDMDNDR